MINSDGIIPVVIIVSSIKVRYEYRSMRHDEMKEKEQR